MAGITASFTTTDAKAYAERLNAYDGFPVGTTVIFGNEENNLDLEWKSPAARELGLEQIPVAWLLDPKGTIVELRRGPLPPAFDEAVEKALRAVPAASAGGR